MMVQNILTNLPNKYFKGLTLKFSCRVPNILEMQKKATKEGSKRALASPRLAIKVRYVRRCAGMIYYFQKWFLQKLLLTLIFGSSNIPDQNSKIETKFYYLENLNSKIGRKTYYIP